MASFLWLWLLLFFALLLLLLFCFRPSSSSSSSSSDSHSDSSSTTDAPRIRYGVFISFRGGDIRTNFFSHLKKEILSKQIDFFVDDKNVHPGDQISPTLLKAIEESFISLVIFSEHYASSNWCMEELVKITECMKQYKRIVMPVFYHVEPYQVRHQKGTFADAFNDHKNKYKVKDAQLQKWRSVLKEIANISGIHYPSPKYEDEAELIEKIVKDVCEKVRHISPNEIKGLIGIDEQVKSIELLLEDMEQNEVGILGIWGMGGIGKTTIAQVIFNKYSSQYQGCCFLKNVREQSQTPRGLDHLCELLVSQLLKKQDHLGRGSLNAISAYDKKRLMKRKVLIVLDDVDASNKLLDDLVEEKIQLGAGSRVIVTTRDEKILISATVPEHHRYKVQTLSFESSLELFCLKAFHKRYPKNGCEELSEMAISYANGNPLALKVLGSLLVSESTEYWEGELRKLKTSLNSEIFQVLKLSYEALNHTEQNMFLDIVFFFKGKHKDDVIRFLDSYDLYGPNEILNLERKALITISQQNTVEMHDLIEQMGLEIVFNESPDDLKKRSRLRNPEHVKDVLENSEGEKSVKGIMCDLSQTGDLHLNADTFKNMPRLRFLKIFYTSWNGRLANVHVSTTLEPFSAKLRYLEWYRYPLNSLPSRFCAERLVELSMPYSQISKLWDGTQDLPNLKVLNLKGCTKLVELPNFSKATKLKAIGLVYCEKLSHLHPSILSIPTLESLSLIGCKELKSIKGNLKSLKNLHATGCYSLEEYSLSSGELSVLLLSYSRIKSLPNEFSCFISIVRLCLHDCRELTELPHNMKALSRLVSLELSGCCGLRSIPELPPSLQVLEADDCTSLERIFSLKAVFSLNRRKISFDNCMRLEEESLNDIMEDAHPAIFRNFFLWLEARYQTMNYYEYLTTRGCFRYPGYKVPEWFRCQTEEASITVELDQPYYQLLGFVFCCVVSQNLPPYCFGESCQGDIHCEYHVLGDDEKGKFLKKGPGRFVRRWNSDHVLIWTNLNNNNNITRIIERCRGSDDDDHSTCNQKISFRFFVDRFRESWWKVQEREEDDENCYIKGCGVFPMYASTVLDAIQKLESESDVNVLDNSIAGINLGTLKSEMIKESTKKSKFRYRNRGSREYDSEEESCSDQEEEE